VSSVAPKSIAYHDIWGLSEQPYEQATCRISGQRHFNQAHYSISGWPTLPKRFVYILASALIAQNHLQIPLLAHIQQYLSDCVRRTDEKHEKSKKYSLRKRLENFTHTSTSNRHNETPRKKNGIGKILYARYNAETQQQLVYWRKGMFSLGRKCHMLNAVLVHTSTWKR